MKKILCLDFDGVLHSYVSGWKGIGVISDDPVPGSLEALTEYVQHFTVVIYSSRSKSAEGIHAMQDWLIAYGLPERILNQIEFHAIKPPAWLTIDDRCMQFEGQFPDWKSIDEFEPWYKKSLR